MSVRSGRREAPHEVRVAGFLSRFSLLIGFFVCAPGVFGVKRGIHREDRQERKGERRSEAWHVPRRAHEVCFLSYERCLIFQFALFALLRSGVGSWRYLPRAIPLVQGIGGVYPGVIW